MEIEMPVNDKHNQKSRKQNTHVKCPAISIAISNQQGI